MPRIRAGNVAAHRELMRAALLDAFGALLADQGYDRLTLAQVAERAGMARNTIYNYAADKEALLMAYIDRAVERFVAEVREELAELPDADAQVRWLVRRQMHQFVEQRGGPDSAMLEGSALSPRAHTDLQGRFAPLHTLLHEVIAGGVARGEFRAEIDPAAVVPMVFAVIASERMPVGTGVREPEAAAVRVIDFVLPALR